jgi:hypothetical protein
MFLDVEQQQSLGGVVLRRVVLEMLAGDDGGCNKAESNL